jgi:hypothetical protein
LAIGVRLMGGLGNQMFQYAAARSLAARHQTGVVVDVDWFSEQGVGDTHRNYGLDVFAGPTVSPKGGPPTGRRFVEQDFGFEPSVRSLPDRTTLVGYFQSERYFSDHASEVKADFSFCDEPDEGNRAVLGLIGSCESVAVHVRRGDYATDPAITAHHGLLPLGYYRRAADVIVSKVREPSFFVFSDDPQWCCSSLSFLPRGVVVDHNSAGRGAEDLRLMASCRHHVLANSTFSWWGAWLATHHEQVVVAPRRWFANASFDTRDLCPSRWILI